MDMVGQHFDELWLYIKSVTDINDRQSDLSKGLSKDLISHDEKLKKNLKKDKLVMFLISFQKIQQKY